MNATQQILLDRLIALEIDEPGAELTFSGRLARENGWSQSYAERMIEEYKRFLFLTQAAGHVTTPSEQVDQVWHLHLIYTRSYWDDLCRGVLGRPLHHGPTKGGAAEQAKFIDLYNQTLASYERLFGQTPPADIWPPASCRFGDDLCHLNVNTRRYWIVPKPRWQSLRGILPIRPSHVASGLLVIPLIGVAWNPLDWRGDEFLALYFVLAAVAVAVALAVRLWPGEGEESFGTDKQPPLTPYEAACLTAGPLQAVNAALASMVQAGTLVLTEQKVKSFGLFTNTEIGLTQGKKPEPSAPALEQELFAAAVLPVFNSQVLVRAGLPFAEGINNGLIQRGLLQANYPTARGWLAALIVATPLVLGLAKIAVGLSRNRPVEFLVIGCAATAIAAIAFLLAHSRLTASGRAMLQSLQDRHGNTKLLAETAAKSLTPAELAMAVGLFGAGMLAVGPLSNLHAMLPRSNSANTGGGGCGGGCGGGSGCGGGGCGGGGCGGGCGGCGG